VTRVAVLLHKPLCRGQRLADSLREGTQSAAILFMATGVAVLTGPSMVPFTIALWLGAAGLLGLATFARLSTD
jgi:hypothetical protein